jgi:hypothetical protein
MQQQDQDRVQAAVSCDSFQQLTLLILYFHLFIYCYALHYATTLKKNNHKTEKKVSA